MSRSLKVVRRFSVLPFLLIAITGLLSLGGRAPAKAADVSSLYTWKPMVITGGGWVVGMQIHPTTPNVIYARTDVGGAYKWDSGSQRWTQLFTKDRFPASYINADNPELGGGVARQRIYLVDAMALDPSNPNVVFFAGGTTLDDDTGVLVRSIDGGNTFQVMNLNVSVHGNAEYRMHGERIVVDPRNSDIVYFGTRNDGLWRSTNGGVDWTQIPSGVLPFGVPINNTDTGVASLAFDPTSGAINGRTSRIYASVSGQGVYMSQDAGQTWNNISSGGNAPNTGAFGIDFQVFGGVLYATFPTGTNGAQGLRKYSPGSGWANITPPYDSIDSFAVDPNNTQRIFAAGLGMNRFYRTTNGGASWDTLSRDTSSPNAPWLDYSTAEGWLSIGKLIFDPHTPNTLWFSEGFAMWRTSDLFDSNVTWNNVSNGIEEVVPNDVIAPPGGKPLTAIRDQSGFRHDNLDASPTKMNFSPEFSYSFGYSYFPGDPSFIVGSSQDNRGCCGDANYSGYSTDGGQNWTRFASITNNNHPADLRWGYITISATNRDNMVWTPHGKWDGNWPPLNDKPYYTTNRGQTWNRINYFDSYEIGNIGDFLAKRNLAADYVNGGTFYYYTWGKLDASLPAKFHRSTDGGATWQTFDTNLPRRSFHGQLKSVPGKAGHLWFTTGYDHRTGPLSERGLYRSTDGGVNFTKVSNFEEAFTFAFGKAAQGATYPTVYVYGKLNGQWGLYRSLNEGSTWDFIVDYPLGLFSLYRTMAADWDVFGRVYMGADSMGYVYSTTTENPVVGNNPTNTPTNPNGLPYAGTAPNLPGRIEFENYNTGGATIAYSDNDTGNNGGTYRSDDVDVAGCSDTGCGYTVGWTSSGEWLKYTVNVQTTGTYTISFRAASAVDTATYHLEVDGVNVTGTMSVPNTGGWEGWQTFTKTGVTLNAGQRVLRFVVDTGSANFNWMEFSTSGQPTFQPPTNTPTGNSDGTPYGSILNLPGRLEVENYNNGGQGVAYNDTDSGNNGGQYRTDAVDIEGTTDQNGGYNVGWAGAGEWLKYTVNVPTAGTYTAAFRLAALGAGGSIHLEVDGTNVTGAVSVPNTGGWQAYQTVTKTGINLSAGQHVLRLVIDSAPVNINWIEFSSSGTQTGSILRQYWTGVTGVEVATLTSNSNYPNNPSGSNYLTSLEAPTDWADNYGTRIRGFVHPPTTGSYTFWIASDDHSELWLSTSDNPANRQRIAYVNGWTTSRQWTKYTTQQSASITLTAGQKYYIEVIQKEGGGGDNVAVAWQGPSISQQVIPGSALSPVQ
jgi:hypothetical protein